METTPLNPAPAAPPSPASPVRLYVLLGLLAIVVGAYGYDYFVAKPACEAADKKIQEFVDARNKLGVKDKEGALVTSADIQKEIGMQPTYVDRHDDQQYTVEYYCWWGKMPMLSRRRHFISVVYVGPKEPRRVSSHHREEPPAEALPIDATALAAESSAEGHTESTAGAPAAADAPAVAETPAAADVGETESSDKATSEGKPAEGVNLSRKRPRKSRPKRIIADCSTTLVLRHPDYRLPATTPVGPHSRYRRGNRRSVVSVHPAT
jgi:hypothetical protein